MFVFTRNKKKQGASNEYHNVCFHKEIRKSKALKMSTTTYVFTKKYKKYQYVYFSVEKKVPYLELCMRTVKIRAQLVKTNNVVS